MASPQFYMKLALCIILSEGYIQWTSRTAQLRESVTIRNNEYYYYVICLSTLFELLLFSFVIFILLPVRNSRTPEMLCKAILLGQSGRLLNIPAIVYRQGLSPFFNALKLAFVFVSCVQSIRAITLKGQITTAVDVGAAMAISFIVAKVFQGFLL